MISELDIMRTAAITLSRHGDGAAAEVEKAEAAMVQRGDMVGMVIWQRVMAALRKLQATKPAQGEVVH